MDTIISEHSLMMKRNIVLKRMEKNRKVYLDKDTMGTTISSNSMLFDISEDSRPINDVTLDKNSFFIK